MTVAAILKHKGNEIFSVGPNDTLGDVARILASRRIGGVLVVDSAGLLLGMLSERDVVNALAANGAWALGMLAAQVMTRVPMTATPQTTTGEALAMMAAGHFRHLPVLDRGVLVGVISIGDVVKHRIMQHEIEVDTLRAYVSGADYTLMTPHATWPFDVGETPDRAPELPVPAEA